MKIDYGTGWNELIQEENKKEYFQNLKVFLREEYASKTIYPPRQLILNALLQTPFEKCNVVILGQDPYHEPGQAMGMSFSVPDGVKIPPSLVNIYKEIDREYGCGIPKTGNLISWAKQGVLLLNTVLTVEAHKANSHAGHGWELFTDAVIAKLASKKEPMVFMLWGSPAQQKAQNVLGSKRSTNQLILKTSHPSPLAAHRGFNTCGHFKTCNEFLEWHGIQQINWCIGDKNSV